MKKLFALLVGIDEYQPPNTPLYGCVKDVNKVEKYINDYHSEEFDLQVLTLLNTDASYANIVEGFKTHLRQASPDDMVWFHFSGHGSEEKSAKEFLALEPNGKDQTLWCADSGIGEVYNLADKELAYLLHEIATSYSDGNVKESAPHIMVSLDCCHSGSGTRDAGDSDVMRTRNARASGRERPVDSYAGGYYANQSGQVSVPSAPHIVLSACQTYQRAGDLNDGGAFTSGLIKALKASKGQINYADLFVRARASVRQIRKNQTPDFASIENFNPYQKFLAAEEFGDPRHYEIFIEKNVWYIRCGAIHGLATDSNTPVEVEIRSFPSNKVLGNANITSVGAQRSKLDVNTSFSIKSTMKDILPGEDHYRGVIKSFPAAPVSVFVHGDEIHVTGIENNWPGQTHIEFASTLSDEHSISVLAQGKSFQITDLKTNTIVQEMDLTESEDLDINLVYNNLFQSYAKIDNWYSFLDLKNKNKASKISDWVILQLHVMDMSGGETIYNDAHVTLYATPENSRGGQLGFLPKAKIKHTSQDVFLYLMYMQPNFAIDCPEGEVIFYAADYDNIKELELALWKNIQGFGPGPSESSVTSHFKLLVTTEKLDYFQFLQSSLGGHRSALSLWQPDKVSDDWATINMAVTVCRQEKSISGNETVDVNTNIKIESHGTIQADIAMSPVEVAHQEGAAPDNAALMSRDNFELVDLRDDQRTRGAQLLELQNLKISDAETLKSNPLQIKLNQVFGENEMIIPMVFDGEFFRAAGDGIAQQGETAVSIDRLPTLQQAHQKSEDYMGERSVFSTMKMAFFKLVLNDNKTNKLSGLEFVNDELKLTTSGMAERVMPSNSFLVILHGVMGDGISMCKDLAVNNGALLKKYDCVLVYDYECLNTPIDETARLLKKDLQKLNIDQREGKPIDIIGHSCGGLVGRWLVEQEGGSQFVGSLTMLGTPNSGSMFGKAEEYRSFALNMLEVAANFMPQLIPGSGLIIKALKMVGNLTPALGQMSPDSDFLTQLNTSADPKIKYRIASGDARSVEGNQASNLIKRLYGDSSRSNLSTEVHDLFTTSKSAQLQPIFNMREIPVEYIEPLQAHHFTLTREIAL